MRGKKGGKKIWSINLLIEIEVLKKLKESLYFEILLLKCGCLVHVKENFMVENQDKKIELDAYFLKEINEMCLKINEQLIKG